MKYCSHCFIPWTWTLSLAATVQPKAVAISRARLQLLGGTTVGIPKEFRNRNFFTLWKETLKVGFLGSPFSFYHITYSSSHKTFLEKWSVFKEKLNDNRPNHSVHTSKFLCIGTLLYLLSSKLKWYPFQDN